MLIRHKKALSFGLLLALSFLGILALIFSPVFGQGKNGLEYSDELFNKLAKGSSYFIPKLTADLKEVEKEELAVNVKMENADQAAKAAKVVVRGAPDTTLQGDRLIIKGNLAKLLGTVLEDSTSMYFNRGGEVRERYGMDAREVMTTWWSVLNRCAKELMKSKKTRQSNVVLEVTKKGVEPAYNFYGIEPQRVADKAVIVLGLLVFYVLYTMWWGFGIFCLFDGLGLSMKKARVKQEV
jgi:hypothetical protein